MKVHEKCTKKAAVIRELETHVPWFATNFIFLFSNDTKFSSTGKEVDPNDTYSRALNPAYGYVNTVFTLNSFVTMLISIFPWIKTVSGYIASTYGREKMIMEKGDVMIWK